METEIQIRDQTLQLLPEKLIWWRERETLLMADSHFGKAATFRKQGIPVPHGTTEAMLERLSQQINKFQAKRLIVLGDFVHSATRCETGFEASLIQWRGRHADLELVLVKGNHDRGHQRLFDSLNMKIVTEPFGAGPFALCHFHTANSDRDLYTLAGHIHPGIRFVETGVSGIKLPCFYFGESYAVLPAFGEFTGLELIKPDANDSVFAVADDEVIAMSRVLKASGQS